MNGRACLASTFALLGAALVLGPSCSSSDDSGTTTAGGGRTTGSGGDSPVTGGSTGTSGGQPGTGGVLANTGGTGTGGLLANTGGTGTGGVPANTGGETTGTGGEATGTGGETTGTGGDGTGGSAGAATGGTAGAAGGIACSHTVPPDERITDFEVWDAGNWGDDTSLTGGSYTYGAEGHTVALTVTDGVLTVAGTVPASGYAGFGLWFGPCVDASEYLGVQFTLGGAHGEVQLVFQVQTSQNYPIDTENEKGECTGTWSEGCASNEVVIEAVPETPEVIQIVWADLSGGEPIDGVLPDEILGIQWQFNCGDVECTPDLTLDNIQFITELIGAGGASGAGGAAG